MNTFLLRNVKIITQYDIIENGFVYVKRGIIMAIGSSSPIKVHRSCSIVDGEGGWLLPGIIDINNDLFVNENNASFFTLEKDMTSHGITSIFHLVSDCEQAINIQQNKFRRLGMIRHHFQSTLPVFDSFYIVNVQAIYGEATISDLINHPAMYILCSDNNTSPILQTIFVLHRIYGLDLVDAVGMATINPARALGLESRLGSIRWGKIADLVLVDESTDTPQIKKVFVSGCKVYDSISFEQSYNNHDSINTSI